MYAIIHALIYVLYTYICISHMLHVYICTNMYFIRVLIFINVYSY